jgi:homocysteine S-methyltransferase
MKSPLRASRCWLMDGAMGSEIDRLGLNVNSPLWGSVALLTQEGRSINCDLHRAYREAGAEILVANTHNLSLAHCEEFLRDPLPMELTLKKAITRQRKALRARFLLRRLHERALEDLRSAIRPLNGEGVAPGADPQELSGVMIAACVASPEPPYTRLPVLAAGDVALALAPQIEVIAKAGVDLVLFEMLGTAADFRGVVQVVERFGLRRVGLGVVFRSDGRTQAGLTVEEVVAMTRWVAPWAYFVQCTPYHEVDRPLVALTRQVQPWAHVGVYANTGRRCLARRFLGRGIAAQRYAAYGQRWVRMGAAIVGGCCGTTPEYIRQLHGMLS